MNAIAMSQSINGLTMIATFSACDAQQRVICHMHEGLEVMVCFWDSPVWIIW